MKYINSLDEALAIINPAECLQSSVITDPNRANNPVVYVTQEFKRQTGYTREADRIYERRRARAQLPADAGPGYECFRGRQDPVFAGSYGADRSGIAELPERRIAILEPIVDPSRFLGGRQIAVLRGVYVYSAYRGPPKRSRRRRIAGQPNRGNRTSALPRFTPARWVSVNPTQASNPSVSAVTTFGEIYG